MDASSSIICLIVMYCDPPVVQKPAIRAEEAVLTASETRSNDNNAIFAVHTQTKAPDNHRVTLKIA